MAFKSVFTFPVVFFYCALCFALPQTYTIRDKSGGYQGKITVNGNRTNIYSKNGSYNGKIIQNKSKYSVYNKVGTYKGSIR